MKRTVMFGLAALLWVLFAAIAVARPSADTQKNSYDELTVKSLLGGLDCGNCGVEVGAAFLLGDLKIQKAVIPLMSMLKTSENNQARIVAALSLCRIGDERGTFAVKRAALFDDDARVRATCAWFYNEYVKAGTFRIYYADKATEAP